MIRWIPGGSEISLLLSNCELYLSRSVRTVFTLHRSPDHSTERVQTCRVSSDNLQQAVSGQLYAAALLIFLEA